MEEVVGELEELDVAILLLELLALTCELLVQDEGTGQDERQGPRLGLERSIQNLHRLRELRI